MKKQNTLLTSILGVSLLFLGCQKEELASLEEKEIIDYKSSAASSPFSNQENDTRSINFNLPNQILNTEIKAEDVFMNKVSGWEDSIVTANQVVIKDNRLKVVLPAKYGSKRGVVSRIEVPDRDAYQLEFEVAFHSQFSLSKGGKVGFGFAVGQGVTGGRINSAGQDKVRDLKLGGSFRLVWIRRDGKHYFIPYVYYQDMDTLYGMDFEHNRYLIKPGKKYNVRLSIRTNTSENSMDGYGKMEVKEKYESNYTTVWEKNDIRWSGNASESMRKITKIYFSVFRGGSSDSYSGDNGAQGIYFDDFSWNPY